MRRRAARLATAAIGTCAAIAIAPWITTAHGRVVSVARALMPWAGLTAAPLAVVARLTGRRRSAAAGLGVAAASAAMCVPLVVRRPAAHTSTTGTISIVHANLLSVNRQVVQAGAGLAGLDADVVTFSEYTPAHATNLKTTELVARYPHRIELVAPASTGTALWSRHPVSLRPTIDTTHHTLVADVHAPGGDLRVIVVHTQSPVAHHGDWLRDMARLANVEPTGPAVMTGDFNASWWHPELRALLTTWRDAHNAVGRGLSCSWPTERWNVLFHWHPPFVRLDHALVTPDVHVLAVRDLHVPGSDHLGLLVTLAPADRSARAPSATP